MKLTFMIDWLILKACQLVEGYFMPLDKEICWFCVVVSDKDKLYKL